MNFFSHQSRGSAPLDLWQLQSLLSGTGGRKGMEPPPVESRGYGDGRAEEITAGVGAHIYSNMFTVGVLLQVWMPLNTQVDILPPCWKIKRWDEVGSLKCNYICPHDWFNLWVPGLMGYLKSRCVIKASLVLSCTYFFHHMMSCATLRSCRASPPARRLSLDAVPPPWTCLSWESPVE